MTSIFRNKKWPWLVIAFAVVLAAVAWLAARREAPAPGVSNPAVTAPAPSISGPAPVAWTARIDAAPPAALPELLRAVVRLPASTDRDRWLAAVVSRWIYADPNGWRAFLDEVAEEDDDPFAPAFYGAIATALPFVSDQTASSGYLAELVSNLVDHFAKSDPRRALQWADQWLLGDALDSARLAVIRSLARDRFPEALAELARLSGPRRRAEALAEIGGARAEKDPDEAIRWARTFPPAADRAIIMNRVLEVMAEKQPERAGAEFQAALGEISGRYAEFLLEDRAARGLPREAQFDATGAEILVDAQGEALPPKVSPDLELFVDSAKIIAHALAARDPVQAAGWLETLPDSFLKTESTRAVMSAWADADPGQAYRFYEKNLWFDAEPAAEIFSAWAAREPSVATTQARRIASPRHRLKAVEGVVEGWADQGGTPAEITAWIDGSPDVRERDAGRGVLANWLEDEQPESAWRLAAGIADEESRASALKASFISLATAEPGRARALLADATGLSARERMMLQSVLDATSGSAAL